MRLKNTTDLTNEDVRKIIYFVRPPNISNFDVMVKNGKALAGRAYYKGSGYHSTAHPFVVCRLPDKYPKTLKTYQIGQLRGKKYFLLNKMEALVYVLAHELRHLWQSKIKRGYRVWGSRGQFSEIDTESYAIHKLREFRKRDD